MNKAIITGRIASNLELRATSTGKSICEFRIATSRPVVRDGEKVTDFLNCRVWNKQAENLVKYQTKGNLVAVIGRMQVDTYQDKDGKNKYNNYILVEELEYLETKKKEEYKDLKTKTVVQDQEQFKYTEDELPF
jgi:single-strand DNA-binding protein